MSIQEVKGPFGQTEISFQTGKFAKQAHGAVMAQQGETVILATAVSAFQPKVGQDFFPLMVDYRERAYAAGKFPGGYFKREARPSEAEILISRLIDRPIRPLFPKGYRNETQVALSVLSVDGENPTDILAINAASTALMISDIPFDGPIGAVRVGLIDGELVVNPTLEQMQTSDLDLVLVGSAEKAMMIEAGANEVTEEKITEALAAGLSEIKKVVKLQVDLAKKAGRKKREVPADVIVKIVEKCEKISDDVWDKIFSMGSKEEREDATKELYVKFLEQFDKEAEDFVEGNCKLAFDEVEQVAVRSFILDKGKRPDGRKAREIRDLAGEVGILPRTHGSALFTRGQTQSLAVITLGTSDDQQRMESLDEGDTSKAFMLHYNFPSFSVGEARPNRGPGRREIGHGALAERALRPMMPSQEDFPYTVRLVSEILESNGSSSMASVCAGSLALMDAGVPIKAAVAGIALGLVTRDDKWQVLTDIQGLEDHHGDMDFKAAGTREGLTALQMDLKIDGVTPEMIKEAFDQAKEARFKILDVLSSALEKPRAELSDFAPRITTIKINPSKIGEVIGPGGKNIRKLVEETGAKIDIDDDGTIHVSSVDAAASEAAVERIKMMTAEAEVGKVYQGTVRKLMPFGAFCEIIPGKDGLVHVSEINDNFVKNVAEYVKEGDVIPVKVIGVDERGKVNLSVKQAKEGGLELVYPGAEAPVAEDSGGRGRGRSRPPRR